MNYTGCPCGCLTKLPWLDDPDCARHRIPGYVPGPPPLPPSLGEILRDMFPEREAEDEVRREICAELREAWIAAHGEPSHD